MSGGPPGATRGGAQRIHWLSGDLKARFGGRVVKVALDSGGTCPNRDGSLGLGGCAWCDAGGSGPDGPSRGLPWREALAIGAAGALGLGSAGVIAYFQAYTSTYAEPGEVARLAEEALSVPGVLGLAFGARPDCLPGEVVELIASLSASAFVWVEVGMQTMHDGTLGAMNRGHAHQTTVEACEALRRKNINCVLHLIAGLPGENREMMEASFAEASRLQPWGVKLHPLHVVKGSRLEACHARGEIKLLEKEAYVALAASMLEVLPHETTIHRLTGERPGGLLVAPDWCRSKRAVIGAIEKELLRRGSRQGSRWRGGAA